MPGGAVDMFRGVEDLVFADASLAGPQVVNLAAGAVRAIRGRGLAGVVL